MRQGPALLAAIWFTAGVVNWIGVAVMAGCAAMNLKDFKRLHRDNKAWHPLGFYPMALRTAMQGRTFWIAFWVSFAALVVNTLAPVALIAFLPIAVALGVFATSAAFNLFAIPFRLWIWRVR